MRDVFKNFKVIYESLQDYIVAPTRFRYSRSYQ